MIESIQFLRAVAVLFVLYFHGLTMVNGQAGYAQAFTSTGAAGVDLFFVISGFVITLVASKPGMTPGVFLARRLMRIVPLYWFYTSLTVCLLLWMPELYAHLRFDASTALCSYLFILSAKNTGSIGTILGTGWTLAYEMYFYVLYALALRIRPRQPLQWVAMLIVAGVVCGRFIAQPPAFALVAFNTLPLEFLTGCLLARCHQRQYYLPVRGAVLSIVLGLSGIGYAGHAGLVAYEHDVHRALYYGLPAALVLYGLLSLDRRAQLRLPRVFLLLGDASYSIYLCHPFTLACVGKLWLLFALTTQMPASVLLLAGMLVSILTGVLSYYGLEKPVTTALNKAYARHIMLP